MAAALLRETDVGPMARLEDVKRDPRTIDVVVQRVASGETLKAITKSWEIPHGPFLAWLIDDDARWSAYRRALVLGGFAESDEAKELLDNSSPDRIAVDKERAKVRQWRASKNANEFFGERLDVMHHRALPSEAALLAQLDALIAGRPGLLDQLLERRAALALPVNELPAQREQQPAEPAHEGA